jgi:hypothetical protein
MQVCALQNMAFNDSIHFIMAWIQCDQLVVDEPPIMNIYKCLSRKEDLDVGWIHAKPYMYVYFFMYQN